jgi:tripartite-type tricarboxylate transporter receptor subunit TctC
VQHAIVLINFKVAMISSRNFFLPLISVFAISAQLVFAQPPSAPAPVVKDTYPSKPIKFIVTYPPGGGNDIIARLLAQKMTESMGQPVQVDNRAGAGGTIGTAVAAKSPPDGYTIVLVSPPFVMAPALYRSLPYDTAKDLVPVTVVGAVPNMLVVHPSVPVKSVAELIAYARAKPMAMSAATLGSATTQHLAAAMFANMSKTDILLVPYKGSAPGMTDLLGGQVLMMFNAMPSTLAHFKSGELRALGVTGLKRSPLAPEIPTVAETLPGFEISTWYGVLAPTGTPEAVIQRLNREIIKAAQLPDVKKKLEDMGVDLQLSSPQAFGDLIKAETTKWAEVIRVTGVRAD